MAFAKSKDLDVRKSTFNDIQGSQYTYYINNFFADPQWNCGGPSKEANQPATPEPFAQEYFCDAEQNSPRKRHNSQSSDLRHWIPGFISESDDRRSISVGSDADTATSDHNSMTTTSSGQSRAQTFDAISEAPRSIASASARAQSKEEVGQCPRTRAFRSDYRRPRITFKWHQELSTVIRCVAFSPDGQMIAAGTREGSVAAWSIPDGRKRLRLRKVHQESVRAIAFYPDGTRLVTASRDATLLVLCASSGRVLLGPLRGHDQCIISVAISPDGCFIFSGDKTGVLRCWCAKTGSMLPFRYRSSSPINSISFSRDGKWVVCGSASLLFFEWQAGEWHFADYPAESFREAKNVSSAALFPHDRVILCAAGNHVQMWHVEKGKEVAREFDMSAKVHSISASPDGRHFVSGSARGDLCICDIRDQRRVATMSVVNPHVLLTACDLDLYAVAFSPDGQFFVGGGAGGLNLYSYRP